MEKVNLVLDGMRAVVDNGLIKVTLNERGSVDSIIKNNEEILQGLTGAKNDVNKKRSFYLDYHANGKFRDLNPEELKLVKQNDEFVHLAYIDCTGLLAVEYHYVMQAGISGLYSYVIARNNSEATLELGEFRTVYRMGIDNFYMAYNSERVAKQPTHPELQKQKFLQDETFEYENGDVYSKYDYAGYFNENPVWGQYGDKFGAWFIPVSTEYYSGGPLKQELLVHYDGIILNYMTGAHLGSGSFQVPKNWEKLYGPWLFYLNEGQADEMVEDAKDTAAKEQEKWPYSWMDEPLYPQVRSSVKGQLKTKDGRGVSGAMVILAGTGGEVLRQKDGYYFYGECDVSGNFEIPHVRPGEYTLYAYATHGTITRQLVLEDVCAEKGQSDLGTLIWEAPKYPNLLWQMGTANRKSTDFKFSNELRAYKWMNQLPSKLDFHIGRSSDKEDWYYAQPKDSEWKIHFELDKSFEKDIVLTVALAGATTHQIGTSHQPKFSVEINGESVYQKEYLNDQAVYRSSMKGGRYHLEEVTFAGSLLREGKNVVTFKSENGAFMYDTILMETLEPGTHFTNKQMLCHYAKAGVISEAVVRKIESKLEVGDYQEILDEMTDINPDVAEIIQTNIRTLGGL